MSGISKTARASMAGGPVQAKADPFAESEAKIIELRKQRKDKLFVVRQDFIDALLEEYDKALAEIKQLRLDVAQAERSFQPVVDSIAATIEAPAETTAAAE